MNLQGPGVDRLPRQSSRSAHQRSGILDCLRCQRGSKPPVQVFRIICLGRPDQQRNLTAWRFPRKQINEPAHFPAFDRLKSLRQLTRHRGAPIAEYRQQIPQCFLQSVWRLMPNKRRRESRTLRDPQTAESRPARRLLLRRKSKKHEGQRGQAGQRQSGHCGVWPRNRGDSQTSFYRRANQSVAWIRYQRCPRVGNQNDRLVCPQPLQHRPDFGILVVFMQGFNSAMDIHRRQQPASPAGILTQNKVAAFKDSTRARRDVPEVADRGRNKHKAMKRGGLAALLTIGRRGRCGNGHCFSLSSP